MQRVLSGKGGAIAAHESPAGGIRQSPLRRLRRAKLSADYDIAVVGSGFAGSLLAMISRRLGHSVVLLERGKHPRFAIGESSTPLSNLLLEELSVRYHLPNLTPLSKWGTWQEKYPDVSCGLKRGFTFYHHEPGRRAARDPERQDQLLVAASPHDAIADTHWYRADVDSLFVREAVSTGVEYVDEVRLENASELGEKMRLEGMRHGKRFAVSAHFVVDATGPRGFLHRALEIPELPLPDLPPTEALYTHFTNVRRLDEVDVHSVDAHSQGEVPPYPVDDAAVHHVFDGGWVWVLHFGNGITSAGVAATGPLAERLGFSEGAPAWQRLQEQFPTVRDQFASAAAELPFVYAPRLSFRSGAIAGRRWAMLPSAAGFVDPLLSTGFPLVLLGVMRLAEIFERDWDSARLGPALAAYARQTEAELLATARLIGSLYASMSNFPLFVSLSMLYFAAASFSETARRLGRPHLANSFLLHDHPAFHLQPLFERARLVRDREDLQTLNGDILRAIEPFNVAGLGDPLRRNWYPVDSEDLLRAAPKLGATRDEVTRLLERCGFQCDREPR
jgi:tetracycline 7-halogenase / FADH2 O2-dependent halogenase